MRDYLTTIIAFLADIVGVYLESEKLGDEFKFFQAIAPYVEVGSYIELQGEDGCRWRWVFDGNICVEQTAKIVWD